MLTYGFYNSVNHDRRYDAIQMSSIFDGIIRDGIFMSIGDQLQVKASHDMVVTVGTGRAWFNHTWTLNSALLPVNIPQSDLLLNRIDAVVLEVNESVEVRANSIKVIKGTPAATAAKPALTNTDVIHQYPLAYITVNAETKTIRQADIESMVGKAPAPYVTGILETVDIEDMVAQWEDQWKRFFEEQTEDMEDANSHWKYEWETWYKTYREFMEQTGEDWREQWDEWYDMMTQQGTENFDDWRDRTAAEFQKWFDGIKDLADSGDLSAMADKVQTLTDRLEKLETFAHEVYYSHSLWYKLYDHQANVNYDYVKDGNGMLIKDYLDRYIETENTKVEQLETSEPILDSDGNFIDTHLVFEFK